MVWLTPPPESPSYTEVCIARAVQEYGTHPDLIRAVMAQEAGKVGQLRYNKDGSFDMGPMQINSVHLPELSRFGITKDMLVNNECLNIVIGTYYLQRGIMQSSSFWVGVGNYHSRTPDKNIGYQVKVWNHLQQLRGERQ
ncbi:lytic transglycosylase domain-containing protein [Burkholderia cenocepacia]|uniref:lytic transglycosylase domain-containing protein n=1 Tax=Burkholderia cenocepacia TaxID=95486 RepID=UPI00084783AF|nr:lytic transglycosylase domain-containing protein [Burkholderia cenocepacia]